MGTGDGKRSLRRRITALMVGASLLGVLGAAVPSQAAKVQGQIIAGPANASYPAYLTPRVVITKGSTVKFTNLDPLQRHDAIFTGLGFGSSLLSFPKSDVISEVAFLKKGTYRFKCSLHILMTGQLIIK